MRCSSGCWAEVGRRRAILAPSTRGALTLLHARAEVVAAGLEVAELVEARAGRREQDDVAAARRRARGGQRVVERVMALARQLRRGLAERVRDGVRLREGVAQRREVLVLAAPAEQQV